MLKKLIPFVLFSLVAFSLMLSQAYAADAGIKVLVRGEFLTMDSAPVVEAGRTLVPLRAVFESLDAYVEWDSKTKTVSALKGETSIKLKVGDNTAYLNDIPNTLDVPAKIVKGRTLVPLRFVSEALGATVDWNGSTKTVSVTYDGSKEKRYTSIGNISNGGYVTAKDNYTYCTLYNGTWKIKDGSSEIVKISDTSFNYINVVDDWMYCANSSAYPVESEQERLYKIKTDGKSLTRISANKARFINIVGDWIYYINMDDETPYKVRTDGKGERRISKTSVKSIFVDDGWLYFQRSSDDALCKMRTSGSDVKVLCRDKSGYFDVNKIGDRLYYRIDGDEAGIYSIKKDGIDKKLVVSGNISSLNYDGELIYYNDAKNNLYTVKEDGSDKKKLATGVEGFMCIANEWIYYEVKSDKFSDEFSDEYSDESPEKETSVKEYRIKKDGSVKQRLDKEGQLVDIPLSKDGYVSSPMPIVIPSAVPPAAALSTKDIAKNKEAVVFIETYNEENEKIASGSGFNIDSTGIIVTNFHVIKGASTIKCAFGDKAYYVDCILNYSGIKDIAILKLKEAGGLPVVTLGDSDRTELGEDVVAIGNPMELQNTVSTGIVSGIRLTVGLRFIQTTASISPGSSGGPLFNTYGQVVGMTTLSFLGTQNINFAIPINSVKSLFSTASKIPISFVNNHEDEVEECEPNNSIREAEEIAPNSAVSGDLQKEGDVDCFKFTLNSSAKIWLFGAFNNTYDEKDASAFSITLSDQNGKELYKSSVSNELESMLQKVSANLDAGTYVITVKKIAPEDTEKEYDDYELVFFLD